MTQITTPCSRPTLPMTRTKAADDGLQRASGIVGGTQCSLRYGRANGVPWIHATDLCSALGWKCIGRVLKSIPHHLQPASALGIQGCDNETFVSQTGCCELFDRRKGGNTQKLRELVLAKVFQEDADYESDEEPAEYTQSDEPSVSIAEITALERLTH